MKINSCITIPHNYGYKSVTCLERNEYNLWLWDGITIQNQSKLQLDNCVPANANGGVSSNISSSFENVIEQLNNAGYKAEISMSGPEIYDGDPMALKKPSILDKMGLKSYILTMISILNLDRGRERKKILKNLFKFGSKPIDKIKWKNNESDLKVSATFDSKYNKYWISFTAKNKFRKNFRYNDRNVLSRLQMDEWNDEYLGTPETHGGITVIVSRYNLETYIQELIDEYEEVTGEKFEG